MKPVPSVNPKTVKIGSPHPPPPPLVNECGSPPAPGPKWRGDELAYGGAYYIRQGMKNTVCWGGGGQSSAYGPHPLPIFQLIRKYFIYCKDVTVLLLCVSFFKNNQYKNKLIIVSCVPSRR